jgi:hypothetical protein
MNHVQVRRLSTHVDSLSVVLETFLDDAFRRLAAENQLSH